MNIGNETDGVLTIAISTYGDRVVGAKKVAVEAGLLSLNIKVLVVHQVSESLLLNDEARSASEYLRLDENITYIMSHDKGLTKSRNVAIANTHTQYLWLMDDDVAFLREGFSKFYSQLILLKDVACVTLESFNESGALRALYPDHGQKLNMRQILRVASFEIVVNCEFIKQNHIRMREDMGVGSGTGINMGEESVLLSDIIRCRGRVEHISSPVVVHPDVSTGTIKSLENVYSKGVVINRCFSGLSRVRYFLSDMVKIFKNKKGEYGSIYKRNRFVWVLFLGSFFSR